MSEDCVLVKIDFKNAFNTLRRDVILEAVAEFTPDLLPFALLSYDVNTNLTFGSFSIDSAEVVQQGDPLGLLFFCLAIHKLILSVKSDLVAGDLDDLT